MLAGVSAGGWATLAAGTRSLPGVRGVLNFAGGVRLEGCESWPRDEAAAAGDYARHTRVPSLWLYGSNDSFFAEPVWRALYAGYRRVSPDAELVAYGVFEHEGHALLTSRSGLAIWGEPVARFLARLKLPSAVRYPALLPAAAMTAPKATAFAAIDDVAAIPYINEEARQTYRKWLAKPSPRAVAIASDGAWGLAWQGDDPLERALAICRRGTRQTCSLYAVNDKVVWIKNK